MNSNGYDRKADDLGNIVGLEHVNITIPDQSTAVTFYVLGLGLTRDPYMNVGLNNMWVNVGGQQFHLPTRGTQKIPGHIGLVLSDLEALKRRLATVQPELKGTRFKWREAADHVAVTGPWGNRFRCHVPGPEFGDMTIGMPYVEFLTPPGTARAIGKFYKTVLQAPVVYKNGSARVKVGRNQSLIFTETDGRIPKFDGHHIAIYIANHSRAHEFLLRRDLIMEESNAHQYRFKDIVDPTTGEKAFELEHEVRSLYHPMVGRIMVNRNAGQTQRNYMPGQDAYYP
ncbi:MAG: hypothetical protein OXF11_18830 [Deltaproteobacteria bacterium]|nr:hypothetical protein [Deltaproteobacteria bacterium]